MNNYSLFYTSAAAVVADADAAVGRHTTKPLSAIIHSIEYPSRQTHHQDPTWLIQVQRPLVEQS